MTQRKNRVLATLAAFSLVTVSACLLGCVYAFAQWYSPFTILCVGLAFVAAFMIGEVVSFFMINCALSSRVLIGILAFFAGALTLYVSWGTNAAIRIPGIRLAGYRPDFLLAYADELYHHAPIEVEDEGGISEIGGPYRLLLWLAEALILVFGGIYAAFASFSRNVPARCTSCGNWQTDEPGFFRSGIPDEDTFFDQLRLGEFTTVDALPFGTVDDDPHLRFDVGLCEQCGEDCSVSVSVISYSSEPSEICIADKLPITLEQFDEIQARAEREAEEPEPEEDDDNLESVEDFRY